MESETPLTSQPRKPGGWKIPLVVTVVLLMVILGAMLAYDGKAEPADDLEPSPDISKNTAENGFYHLYNAWAAAPKPDSKDKERIARVLSGREPADDDLVARLRKGNGNVAADLHAALEKPLWGAGRFQPGGEILEFSRLMSPFRYLLWEAYLAGTAGDANRAAALIRDTGRMVNRLTMRSHSLIELLVGASMQTLSADVSCGLLTRMPGEETVLTAMEEQWGENPLTAEVIRDTVLGELPFVRAAINGPGPVEIDFQKSLPAYARLLLKKNLTLNRLHELTRFVIGKMGETASTLEESPGARLEALAKPRSPLSFNAIGDRIISEWAGYTRKIFTDRSVPKFYFFQRAMRTRLALERWRMSHGGALPRSLSELVPAFLSEVPADPWTGKPLLWDVEAGVIYATGADWLENPPVFKDGYVSTDINTPALRLAAPPPPPSSPSKK